MKEQTIKQIMEILVNMEVSTNQDYQKERFDKINELYKLQTNQPLITFLSNDRTNIGQYKQFLQLIIDLARQEKKELKELAENLN